MIREGESVKLFIFILFAFFDVQSIYADGKVTRCENGMADIYPCLRTDLLSRVDLGKSGLPAKGGNDVWGWTDPATSREYAVMGLTSKTSFVDITDPVNPVHLGDLPSHTVSSIWKSIKTYRNYAVIVSEAPGSGLQIFDMTELRGLKLKEPTTLLETAHYNNFGSAHDVAVNEESGFAYAVGSTTCDAGAHIVDIRNPMAPRFSACVDRNVFEPAGHLKHNSPFQFLDMNFMSGNSSDPGETYTHDIQCVNYKGPDQRYAGSEICLASNSDSLNIVDVTNKSLPRQLSVITYANASFVHQGWLTEDHRYFLLDDEIDEMRHGLPTTTYVFDVSDLEHPIYIGKHESHLYAVDHNMYIRGNHAFQSNYTAGLRILKIGDLSQMQVSDQLTEVAFFDTYPQDDSTQMAGTWNNYPYYPSGAVAVSNIDGALFIVKPYLDNN
jgi:hypothetical protein